MGQTEFFTYLSSFVIIVLAVAIADLINSLHRLIRARKRVTWHPLPLMMALLATIAVISEFFSLWWEFDVTDITMMELLGVLSVPGLLALFAYSVLPDEVPPEGLDLWTFYMEERRVLCALLGLAFVCDMVRVAQGAVDDNVPASEIVWYFLLLTPAFFIPLLLISFTKKPLWQWIGVLGLLAVNGQSLLFWELSVES